MTRWAPKLSANQAVVLLAVGFVAVAAAQLMGFLANSLGANGALVGVFFAQGVILLGLTFSERLRLPNLNWRLCLGRGFIVGTLAWVLATLLSALLGWSLAEFFDFHAAEQSAITSLRLAGPAEFTAIALLAGIGAPLCEEVYFRGWWLGWALNKGYAPMSSCAVIALVFALLHGNWTLVPGLWLAGFLFGWAALRWGLLSAVMAHMVFNLMTIFAARGGWL